MNKRLPILRGNLDLLVLKALASRPMHGFELSDWLDERSSGALELLDSALYQSLYRMEARELVTAEWAATAGNRQARYYTITSSGRRHLKAHTADWTRYARAISDILGGHS